MPTLSSGHSVKSMIVIAEKTSTVMREEHL